MDDVTLRHSRKTKRMTNSVYKNGQACPICGSGKLAKKTVDEKFEYKGQSLVVPDYVVYECSSCEESLVDKKSVKTSQKLLKDFFREVDGLLGSSDIKRIRKKLGFTQEQMAKKLGVGLKTFARYETGQVIQSRAMDNLLRILDKHPEALNAIEPAKARKG